MRYLLLLALTSCIRLAHVDPLPRTVTDQQSTHVRVTSSCSEPNPFDPGLHGPAPIQLWPDVVWGGGTGSGVIISERHVITAAHVVSCPMLPRVYAYLPDGRRFRMVVERDDAMFGSGADVARLEIASAERFELHIAPPALGIAQFGEVVCTPRSCGRVGYGNNVPRLGAVRGDSGTGVYSSYGYLVGIVVQGSLSNTMFEPIGPYWLEGT